MKQQEINELIKVRTEEDIKKLYPNSKVVTSKLTHIFYNIKPNVWIRCSYMKKDGTCCRDFNSGHATDIDDDHLLLDSIYTGNEKLQEYKNIWIYNQNI